jgi:hypothetical protein
MATLSSSNGNLHIDAKAGNNLYLSWYNTATTQVGGGIAATVFYDRDNTGYFIDPTANQSIRTVGDWRADSSAWTGEFAGKIQYHINNWYFQAAGSWEFRRSDSANAFSVTQAGLVTAAQDMRAPIFYDNQNTNYYLDPASGFNFLSSGVTFSSSGSGLFVTNAESTGAVVRLGAAWSRPGSYSSTSYTLGSESSLHFWISGVEKGYIDSSSNLLMNGSMRAPIFYDINDTAYYLDPNTTGLALKVNGNIECFARSAAWAEGVRIRVPTRATWGGIRFTRDEGNSNGNWGIGYTGIDSTDDLTFWGNLSGGEGMRARLTQTGNFTASGNVTAFSDIRIKKDVATVTDALELVGRMRGVTYTRKDTGEAGVGVIAQEMLEVMPQVVQQDGGAEGTLSVAYGNLVGVLIEAIKELEARVAELEGK